MKRQIFVIALATASVFGRPDGKSVITASAGSVAASNTTNGSSPWRALDNTAKTATISYTHSLTAGNQSLNGNGPTEFKCVNSNGDFAARIFTGDHASLVNGTNSSRVDVNGGSTFSNPGTSSAPTYYQATWAATAQASGYASSSSGTYDPWKVTYGDLIGAGVPLGGTASLYYQTDILSDLFSKTGLDLGPTATGSYGIDVYVTRGGVKTDIFTITESSTSGLSVSLNATSGFSVYALGSNATDQSTDPSGRRSGNGASQILNGGQLASLIGSDMDSGGSLTGDIFFGIYLDNLQVPNNADPNAEVLSWHTDTISTVQSVPEPSGLLSLIGLASGGALIRRRRR